MPDARAMRPRTTFRVHDALREKADSRSVPPGRKMGVGATSTLQVVPLMAAAALVYEQLTLRSQKDERLRDEVLQAGLGEPGAQDRVKALIAHLLTEHRIEVDPATCIAPMNATESVFAQTCGAGLLEDLYRQHDVEELQVVGCDIFVVKGGVPQRHARRFSSLEEVRLLQDRLALCGKKPINERSPVRQSYLHNRSRLVMTREHYSDVPTICIRNFIVKDVTLVGLAELQTLDSGMVDLLRTLVHHHASIIVGGGTNTGKTTLLFALAQEIPHEERIVTLEKEFEIALRERLSGERNVVALREVEDAGLPMEEAFKPVLVMSPKWVIVGEAKGAEVAQMMQGSLRGHDIMGTMHTKYRDSFLSDVADMVKQDGRKHDERGLRSRIARAFNILIYLRLVRVQGKIRRLITEITELQTDEGGRVRLCPLVVWNYEQENWIRTGGKLSRPLIEHLQANGASLRRLLELGVME